MDRPIRTISVRIDRPERRFKRAVESRVRGSGVWASRRPCNSRADTAQTLGHRTSDKQTIVLGKNGQSRKSAGTAPALNNEVLPVGSRQNGDVRQRYYSSTLHGRIDRPIACRTYSELSPGNWHCAANRSHAPGHPAEFHLPKPPSEIHLYTAR